MQTPKVLELRHATDQRLIEDVLARRPDAIDRFVQRMTCVPRILRTQNRRLGDPIRPDELHDLAQDVLLIIWRKLDRFEGRSALETWVFRVCRLELLNLMRRRRRIRTSEVDGAVDQVPEAHEEEDVVSVDAELAYHALQELGPPPSDVILMKHFDHMTFTEIGEQLGMSINTTKSHYYRGLTRLRETLGLDDAEEAA